jgi:transcriptional regulator with XRE-family HTH domain
MATNQNLLKQFGRTIQTLRKELGISQEELAYRAGFHRTYIGMIERAERNITLSNIQKLADALNITLTDLFERNERIENN